MNHLASPLTFTVPLAYEAHEQARSCYENIADGKKAKQVYLNTLAVYAVNYYLTCLGFITDWQSCDSYNPVLFQFMDVGDLMIVNKGKVECRPVLPDATVGVIPPETWDGRIAYLFVRFNASLKEAEILGFIALPEAEIPLGDLNSLEDFLLSLDREKIDSTINLRGWLVGKLDRGWQLLDPLLNTPQLALGFRNLQSPVIGGIKSLDFPDMSLYLKLSLTPITGEETNILAQVYAPDTILPEGVKLVIADEDGNFVEETTSGLEDDLIQFEFSAIAAEKFQIIVIYGNQRFPENFEI
ncbi:MAG: hypothetical protein N5P05_001000 [Chroococcopsis gigantea SAG 12.99]|jgi:hypothetical protein|nr:DUF1822 family protein [Chlorogloea purpurea SAG 13.99]MDV2999394.1 hypothetical protein [Chroococcopsis gigantea SAG 12.99]